MTGQLPKSFLIAVANRLNEFSIDIGGVFNRDDVLPMIMGIARENKISSQILWTRFSKGVLDILLDKERAKANNRIGFFDEDRLVILGESQLVRHPYLTRATGRMERDVHAENFSRQREAFERKEVLFRERDIMFRNYPEGTTYGEILRRLNNARRRRDDTA